MDHEEWTYLVPIFQPVLNNSPTPQRGNVCSITAFMGRPPNPPIKTFLCTITSEIVTLTEAQAESALNIVKLLKLCDELYSAYSQACRNTADQHKAQCSVVNYQTFWKATMSLSLDLTSALMKDLCLWWQGPLRVTKAFSDYFYQVEYLCKRYLDNIHVSWLKIYHDSAIQEVTIVPHILLSERGMFVCRVPGLEDIPNGLCFRVRWKGHDSAE